MVGTKGQSQSRAVLYTDAAGLQDLNTLIDPSRGWLLLAANDVNDAGQIVGYASNSLTGQTHAVRLRPTAVPPPECSFQCLRSTSIELRSKGFGSWTRRSVMGMVTVQDENGVPIPGALVAGSWTRPDDGGKQEQSVWTDSNGMALFATQGTQGTYTLRVLNIVLSLHTFDPSHSVLVKSITVTK